eukprot:COSAG06_NODE_4692_length_4031_cov_4.370869_4_plen_178_part_00
MRAVVVAEGTTRHGGTTCRHTGRWHDTTQHETRRRRDTTRRDTTQHDKTQDKTRHKISQDKPQDETRQDKTQDKTRQDKTETERTGKNRPRRSAPAPSYRYGRPQSRSRLHKTRQDRTGQDRTGQDRTGQDWTGQDMMFLSGEKTAGRFPIRLTRACLRNRSTLRCAYCRSVKVDPL